MADALSVDVEKRFATGRGVAAAFSVTLAPGEILVLFGPSGSGKTTVLRSIAGLERPDRGSVVFGGERWFDAARHVHVPPQRRQAACVFQDAALFPHLTVRQNVEFGVAPLPTAERDARVEEIFALLHLGELARSRPRQLSGGEAQRVALARALATRPRLLLLDEPFASLDTPTRGQLRTFLRASIRSCGMSAVLVTHDRTEAMALGDKMAVLAAGAIRQVGDVEDVFRRPADLVVARTLAVESVLSGTIERVAQGMVDLRVGGTILHAVDAGLDGTARNVFACIRAEDVTLERAVRPGASTRNHLAGRIISVESEGAVERVTIDCGFPLAALVTRQAREEMALQPGTEVVAGIKATAIHLVARA